MNIKKFYLISASLAVTPIALLYGIAPDWFARTFLGMPQINLSLVHIFRAITGLYLALGLFWLYAAFKPEWHRVAVLTTIVFSGGLVVGRLLSVLVDGFPSPILIFYLVVELTLVPIAIWILRRP
jgi:Domain of unknown function (DUF4345)